MDMDDHSEKHDINYCNASLAFIQTRSLVMIEVISTFDMKNSDRCFTENITSD